MSQAELFAIVQGVHEQYATLFAQVISINFAMIVAIYYFLRRTRLGFRLAAYGFYLVGMVTLLGMMLHEANVKSLALTSMTAVPASARDPLIAGYLAMQDGWLFRAISAFQNIAFWVLAIVVAFMLFGWRDDGKESRPPG
jgi:hypothetical protein